LQIAKTASSAFEITGCGDAFFLNFCASGLGSAASSLQSAQFTQYSKIFSEEAISIVFVVFERLSIGVIRTICINLPT
jgi:hypothetical protein